MALTNAQLKSLNNLHGLPLTRVICIGKAAVQAYTCAKAARKDPAKLAMCALALVADIDACLKG